MRGAQRRRAHIVRSCHTRICAFARAPPARREGPSNDLDQSRPKSDTGARAWEGAWWVCVSRAAANCYWYLTHVS